MSDFEDIQRLIRLKRHEQPSEDFVEDFVSRFQQRQRAELLQQSARGLLWERVNTYFEGLFVPKWSWAAASAVALFGVFFVFKPGAPPVDTLASGATVSQPAGNGVQGPISDVEVERYLISRHYEGGLADEHARTPIAQGPEYLLPQQPVQNSLLPAGFKLDLDGR